MAKTVTIDPGAKFDFSGSSFRKKNDSSYFSQRVEIARAGSSTKTIGTLICDGKTNIGEANKQISAKFKNWDWYQSFMYYQPNEQHVEDGNQRAADPVGIQRGTASESK